MKLVDKLWIEFESQTLMDMRGHSFTAGECYRAGFRNALEMAYDICDNNWFEFGDKLRIRIYYLDEEEAGEAAPTPPARQVIPWCQINSHALGFDRKCLACGKKIPEEPVCGAV